MDILFVIGIMLLSICFAILLFNVKLDKKSISMIFLIYCFVAVIFIFCDLKLKYSQIYKEGNKVSENQIYKEENNVSEKIVTYAENYARQENELADSEIEKVSIEILTRKKMYLIRLIVNNSEKKAFFLNYIIVLNDELDLQWIKPISDSEWTELMVILQYSKGK